jgi:hypothetical protein
MSNANNDKWAKLAVLAAVTIAGGPVIGPIVATVFDKIIDDD